jgi:hypothetical protein
MKTIIRRLDRLEERLAPCAETEFVKNLRERIEQGNRRVAEARESGLLPPPPPDDDPHVEFWRKRLVDATAQAERKRRLGRRNSYRY